MSEAKTAGGKLLAKGDVVAGRYSVLEVLSEDAPREYRVKDEQAPAQAMVMRQQGLQGEADKLKRNLERALRAMSWIRHAGVIVPRDIFVEGDSVFSVQPQAVGVPFDSHIRQAKPTLAEIVKLIGEISTMLDQLHESRNPYFLGQIPPENLLVSPDGTVQLIGFQLSQEWKVEYKPESDAPEFKAPDSKLDARSDIWCLGTLMDKAADWSEDKVKKAYQNEADLRAISKQVTAPEPDKRIPNMSTLKTRLDRLKWKDAPRPKTTSVTDAPITVHTVEVKSQWQEWMEEYRAWILLGTLSFIAFIGFLVWLFPQRD